MATSSDTKRPQSIRAEFDSTFDATASGGAALAEKTLRALGVQRYLKTCLPARSAKAQYSMPDAVWGLLGGLLLGGRGIQAGECLREDPLLAEIFGLSQGVASPATLYRVLGELSGLEPLRRADCYAPTAPARPALDMFGAERRAPALRRIVPETAEAASAERLAELDTLTSHFALRCVRALKVQTLRMHGWYVCFGDGTDLEVEGNCFDAARVNYKGRKVLRWQTVMLGPVTVAQRLAEGDTDEGLAMPQLLERAQQVVRQVAGRRGRVLGLFDAAYFERQVVDALTFEHQWDWIVCANQQRGALQRLAEDQPELIWHDSGPDARRGWESSQTGCFLHRPEGWAAPVTIVARRWRETGELPGMWHYSFIGTRMAEKRLPQRLLEKHGYCETLWMLYSTKQGHENHYKTLLRDFGLHHPPSCRLGVNQAFYTIATLAANVAMVLRYRVVDEEDSGIAFWRLRERYFRIAGQLARGARCLTVRLSGLCVDARRQVLWREAFATAGSL